MVYLSNAIVTDESVDKIETGIIEKASLEDVDGDEKIIVFMEHIVSQFDVNAYVDEATAGKIQTVMFGGQHMTEFSKILKKWKRKGTKPLKALRKGLCRA